jgi:hypothetical protein
MATHLYEIVVRGTVPTVALVELDALDVVATTPTYTRLEGWLPDQPALHGMLARLTGLGLELVSVRSLDG